MTSILLISPVFLGFRCAVNAFSTFLLNDFGAFVKRAPKSLMITNPILCGLLYKDVYAALNAGQLYHFIYSRSKSVEIFTAGRGEVRRSAATTFN